jgi:hypothetical protein
LCSQAKVEVSGSGLTVKREIGTQIADLNRFGIDELNVEVRRGYLTVMVNVARKHPVFATSEVLHWSGSGCVCGTKRVCEVPRCAPIAKVERV